MKDIKGDGYPEVIVSSVINFRTDFQGSVGVYQINQFNELVEIDIPHLDVNFIGGECEELQGYNSRISFEENKLKIFIEAGGCSCEDQKYQSRTYYYVWSEDIEEFILEQ